MDLHEIPTTTPRHDGWNPARVARFLDHLAAKGNVRAACAHVGLSAEAAYRLRRRDALFARGWAAALALAREASAEALAARATDGVEEEVWFRGEVVGTRRRYDNRLLLAHMARLDKLAEENAALRADTARFDELVARAAGLALPKELASEDGELPDPRERFVQARANEAVAAMPEPEECASDAEPDEAAREAAEHAYIDQCAATGERAACAAAEVWDAWLTDAHETVDRLLASSLDGAIARETTRPRTPSTASTSRCSGAVPTPPDAARYERD